jgi:putative ABC transport system permease protein
VRNTSLGYHFVVGGKNGSKLDLILSSVYYTGKADQPFPYSYYKQFITAKDEHGHEVVGKFANKVKIAVPVCLGDNYQSYRVVGTTADMFRLQYGSGQAYEFADGKSFEMNEEGEFHAVVGAEVARKTSPPLRVGDTFKPTHGVVTDGHVHDDEFTVVGILKPTGTPNDRALFINIDGFYHLRGHADEKPDGEEKKGDEHKEDEAKHKDEKHKDDGHKDGARQDDKLHHHEELSDDQKRVSAILVLAGSSAMPEFDTIFGDQWSMELYRDINRGADAQAETPADAVANLMTRYIDPLRWTLLAITILTVVVAGVGIMVGIYNSMSGRRHEIAVLRALGAGRTSVMLIVLLESILLSVMGGVAGMALGHAIVAGVSPYLVDYTGVSIGFWQFGPWEAVVLPALVGFSSIVGYLPAVTAYRTDVVKGLSAMV